MRLAILLVSAVAAMLAAGCIEKRKPESGREGASRTEPKPAQAGPADYARNLSSAPARAAAVVDVASIEKAAAQFEAMEGRLPASIEELVAKHYLPQMPPVPPGRRLDYDPATGKATMVTVGSP